MINWRLQVISAPACAFCAVAASHWFGVWRVMLLCFALALICLLAANLLMRWVDSRERRGLP